MLFKDKLISNRIPRHVAIIMDGNGRWAAQSGNERTFGHEHGVEAVRSVVAGAGEIGIEYLTLYAFSTENWARPKEEVDALMGLLVQAISEETDELQKSNVRLRMIGDIASLPLTVQEKLNWSIDKLNSCTGLTLVLALSYSSKWEILEAVKRIAFQVKLGKIEPAEINFDLINCFLNTSDMPDPELLIRTSGEYRMSNFLLWQLAYTELYFTDTYFPDFREVQFEDALTAYAKRQRRFGASGEQSHEDLPLNFVQHKEHA